MMRGDFSNLSESKLMDCLNRLGYDIEIKVKPAFAPVGHLKLAIAGRLAMANSRRPGFASRSCAPVDALRQVALSPPQI